MYTEALDLASVEEAPPRRPRVLIVATGFVSAGVMMYFAALFGIYLSLRAEAGAKWIPEEVVVPLTQPNMMFVTLILSVVMVHWAASAARHDDRPHLYLSLGITLLLGFAFANQLLYTFKSMQLEIGSGEMFALLAYVLAISHLVLLLAAMLFMVVVSFRALGGQETSIHHDGVRSAALFWDVMVFIFALTWIIVYVTK